MAPRGGAAGAAAAAAWFACDPLLKRAFGTPYADSELVGPFLTRGRLEPLANFVTHAAAGAVFGRVFVRLGGRGVRAGVAAAVVENTLLWPSLVLVERVHPKRRDGTWPRLVTSRRAFAAATTGHALFGALLGAAVARAREPGS
ncbi:MAG TPA: hypothetical protein VJ986_04305 [Gaiellaceae bacterium]|nr:hypothetical protein [Gaiellaceae bacterium]